jgi:hypothetical protein
MYDDEYTGTFWGAKFVLVALLAALVASLTGCVRLSVHRDALHQAAGEAKMARAEGYRDGYIEGHNKGCTPDQAKTFLERAVRDRAQKDHDDAFDAALEQAVCETNLKLKPCRTFGLSCVDPIRCPSRDDN